MEIPPTSGYANGPFLCNMIMSEKFNPKPRRPVRLDERIDFMNRCEWTLASPEHVPEPVRTKILEEIPGLQWRRLPSEDPTPSDLEDVDVYFGLFRRPIDLPAQRLRWIQYPFAGVPEWLSRQALAKGIQLSNASGIYDQTIAEHVVGCMLALSRRFDSFFDWKLRRIWAHPVRPAVRDLAGSTAVVLGMGRIGRATARMLKFFAVRVVGCRRTPQPTPYADEIFPVEDLQSMVRRADWLIVAAPLTAETRGLASAGVLRALPPGARVVNVGRGPILDQAALVDLLRSGRLAGAALDVTNEEPIPYDDPLWTTPNLLLTQHSSCNPADASPAAAELLLRNLHRYAAGLPLENAVDLARGY